MDHEPPAPPSTPEAVLDAVKAALDNDPNVARLVEVVDNAIINDSCSCYLFGWMFSAKRLPRSPAKSEVPLNKESS